MAGTNEEEGRGRTRRFQQRCSFPVCNDACRIFMDQGDQAGSGHFSDRFPAENNTGSGKEKIERESRQNAGARLKETCASGVQRL